MCVCVCLACVLVYIVDLITEISVDTTWQEVDAGHWDWGLPLCLMGPSFKASVFALAQRGSCQSNTRHCVFWGCSVSRLNAKMKLRYRLYLQNEAVRRHQSEEFTDTTGPHLHFMLPPVLQDDKFCITWPTGGSFNGFFWCWVSRVRRRPDRNRGIWGAPGSCCSSAAMLRSICQRGFAGGTRPPGAGTDPSGRSSCWAEGGRNSGGGPGKFPLLCSVSWTGRRTSRQHSAELD